MLRQALGEKGIGDDPHFRWRGGEVSRIEALSDAVFAFSMTLLIVSLEVPRSYQGLMETLKQFPAFGISFLFLFFTWYQHYTFFRRYGLNDMSVVLVNGVLMFLVLFFVFPFRWLVSLLINGLLLNNTFGLDVPVGVDLSNFTLDDYFILHTVYALGFSAIFACFSWFYFKAISLKGRLLLDEHELALTRASAYSFLCVVIFGLVSVALVWVLPQPWNAPIAGWLFALIWPCTYVVERKVGRVQQA